MNKLSIVEVIEQYTELKRAGKEWRGLCPFHSERTPSFFVNQDKGVFRCHGCLEGGDVITFIQKAEGLGFKDALAHLGMDDAAMPGRRLKSRPTKQAADTIAEWAQEMANRIGDRLREVGQRAHMARKAKTIPGTDEPFLDDEISRCDREWSILEIMQEDLFNPALVIELWNGRESLEKIIDG